MVGRLHFPVWNLPRDSSVGALMALRYAPPVAVTAGRVIIRCAHDHLINRARERLILIVLYIQEKTQFLSILRPRIILSPIHDKYLVYVMTVKKVGFHVKEDQNTNSHEYM